MWRLNSSTAPAACCIAAAHAPLLCPQYLQNRTDAQLADILESIRATNFRRAVAISVIYTALRKAVTSSNVLGMLQALQVEDLERLASMPLTEDQYQKLTNVTLLELLGQVYSYGQTQVGFGNATLEVDCSGSALLAALHSSI